MSKKAYQTVIIPKETFKIQRPALTIDVGLVSVMI